MFKNIYTTRMSGNVKILKRRFDKINSNGTKNGKWAVIICAVLIITAFLLSTVVLANLEKGEKYTLDITNNGEVIELENKPFIENGEVYVPLREFFTKLGLMESDSAKMEWDNGIILINLVAENLNEDSQIPYTGYFYKLEIGKSELVINPDELLKMSKSQEFIEPMDLAPVLRGNITYIPFAYADRIVERADHGLMSPLERYKLGVVYSGTVLSISYPVEGYYEITQPFGKRVHPINDEEQFHTGIDFKVDEGTPVKAGMAGTVTENGFDAENGNYVVIKNEYGVEIMYSHLSEIARWDVHEVKAEDIIGKSGNTGKSTGAHLHMDVRINGEYVNPELYLEESLYDMLLVEISRYIERYISAGGYPDSDYKILGVEYNMESIEPTAAVKVQLNNYDNKIVYVLYTYYKEMNMWMGSDMPVDEAIANLMMM